MKHTDRKIFKDAEDFGGFWLGSLKKFKGHEGEPCFQGNILKNGKKIGFFSHDDWGGPIRIEEMKKEDQEEFVNFAKGFTDSEYASLEIFIDKIIDEIEDRKSWKRKCSRYTYFILDSDIIEEGFRIFKYKFKDHREGLLNALEKKYGDVGYVVINEIV